MNPTTTLPEAPTASATSASLPRVPFIIGVTGNMDPAGYADEAGACHTAPEMVRLAGQFRDILDWVTGLGGAAKGACLDPVTGRLRADAGCQADDGKAYHSCWKPLDLAKSQTPILILSSLAPGVDTLMVEVAAEYHRAHPGADVRVCCPLPFPLEYYADASSFNTPERKARLAATLALIRETWPDAETERSLFAVQLDNDLLDSTKPDQARDDLTAVDAAFKKPRRHLRYRAAGEYVATHSDLLLAVYDVDFDKANASDLFESGTATIVECKRNGLSHEVLAVSNNFAWADNGPVLVLPIHRQKKVKSLDPVPTELGAVGPLKILHPYDTKPAGSPNNLPDGDAAWQRAGDSLFRRILDRQKEFNALGENKKEAGELTAMTGVAIKDTAAWKFARSFDAIARIRRRAADVSAGLGTSREKLLKHLLWLIFVAALSFGAFEHWHNSRADAHADHVPATWLTHDPQSLIQTALLLISLICLAWSGVRYFRYSKSGAENRRFDYRAIGEGLRVQFYWLLTGTGRGVSADYMQRQRDELDWIRYVVSSLAVPIEVSRREFTALSHATRHCILEAVHQKWVIGQMDYFNNKAPVKERLAHHFHSRGWTLAAGGLLSIIFMLLAEASPAFAELLHHDYYKFAAVGSVAGLGLLSVKWWRDRAAAKAGHGHAVAHTPPAGSHGFLRWIFGDLVTWGGALVVHSTVILLAFFLGSLSTIWPDEHNTWIILTGAVLLAGGLSVAWAERNFFGEEARMFRSMGNLYTCANRRLIPLLKRYGNCADSDPQAPRLLYEIQDIYYQIGCEALNENAEWLIQHRSRPLEPFMAG